jgi:hypothetical protein
MRIDLLDGYISHFILNRLERHHDVEGAPFKIGQKVLALDNPNKDETFDVEFAGLIGEVSFFEYDGGCGQRFPFDPMIGVEFDNKAVGEFWREELELVL